MHTKNKVLELLEKNRGSYLSGENIASQLQLSRTSVWKAIKSLAQDGYPIHAVTNKGYALSAESNILSVQGLATYLSDAVNTEKIFVYQSLPSTNTTAKEMAIAGAAHGAVVMADCQTAGKGRYNRGFFSPPGVGLYMSFILHPQRLCFENATTTTAFAAVAVCESIEAVTQKKPGIKWVNDIFLDGKKICGILTEAVTDFESRNLHWIVLGIGINVQPYAEGFPPDIQQLAGTIYPDGPIHAVRNRLAAEIINRILGAADHLDEKQIFEKYKRKLFILGKKVTVADSEKTYEATAVDIDHAGRLIVRKTCGAMQTLHTGEIRIKI